MIAIYFKLLRREIVKALRAIQFVAFRMRMEKAGVMIHHQAHVFGAKGVRIGSGTSIRSNAVIAATKLGFFDCLSTDPKGAITLGESCRVCQGAIIAAYGGTVTIGNDVSINPGAILYGMGGLTIGDATRIAAHTVIVTANHVFSDPNRPILKQGIMKKGVEIGRDVWIGAGVRILDGVRVGDGAVIGAGAVVNRDIDPNTVVAGVPAKIISLRNGSSLKCDPGLGDAENRHHHQLHD